MTTEGQTQPKTEEQLFEEMTKALREGDTDSIRALTSEDTPLNQDITPPQEPAPEENTPQETTPPVAEATPPNPDDWESGLPEEVKVKVKTLKEERNSFEQRIKSELGRVPNLQRELAKAARRIEELERRKQEPPKKPDAAPRQGTIAEKLAQLKELDPDLASIFDAYEKEVIHPLREELGNEVKQVKGMFASREEEQLWNTEKSKLLERHPQADEIFALPLWKTWKETLTPSKLALASSIYAEDVSEAIEMFARYAATHFPDLVKAPEQPAAPAAPSADAQRIEEERRKKLAAKPPASTTAPPKAGDGIPDDPEAMFAYFQKKIRNGEM